MKKKIFGIALMLCMLASAAPKAFAIADSETYTVTVSATNSIVLAASATDFGSIAPGGANNTSSNVITVGDGVVATSTSYIQSNDATAPAKQYTLTFAGSGTETVAVADNAGTNATLTVANAAATSDVVFFLTDGAASPTTYPMLGDPAGTEVAFDVLDATTLNIAAASSVPFDATTKKAPLSMKIDLKEDSVTMADADATLGFVMTFTCVGL
ncbi:MAG: hypothetical protein ACD_20C00090G0009 [uncultured bacterium]|nr:MAG: hypothetical protein ACD_20C00090G0009 [uncultured bacterium]HBH18550.1 hypothetical protein [Cyanobacteria bacterium UBA9579]